MMLNQSPKSQKSFTKYSDCPKNSQRTAIRRNKPSPPLRFLLSQKIIKPSMKILDYGCGKQDDMEALKKLGCRVNGYDPFWYKNGPALYSKQKYDVILCSYVFCVLDKSIRAAILDKMKTHLKDGGKMYISVRRDIKEDYSTPSGTNQYVVHLDLPIVEENSSYCIYEYSNT